MINTLILQKLPNVNGNPGDGQASINWIKNGEKICAATTDTSDGGTLNRPSVQIQENARVLSENDTTTAEKVNEVIFVVNNINDSLDSLGDSSLIDLVNAHNTRIRALESQDTTFDFRLSDIERGEMSIKAEIGERNPDDSSKKTIYDDLFFQKKELGAYPGFNIDGMPDRTNPGSGLKYRVTQNSLALSSYDQRITKLEDDYIQSDVGALNDKLDRMRAEIGPATSATGFNIYLRLSNLEKSDTATSTELASIKSVIDFDNVVPIKDRVEALETSDAELKLQVQDRNTGLLTRTSAIETAIGNTSTAGSLVYAIHDLSAKQNDLELIVGKTSAEGIRGQLVDINTQIGTDTTPNSILGSIAVNSTTINALNTELSSLSAVVGTSNTGLVAAMAIVGTDLYGDHASTDPVIKDGLKVTVNRLAHEQSDYIQKPADTEAYFIQNQTLVHKTVLAADIEKDAMTIAIATENVDEPISLDTPTTTYINGITTGPTLTFDKAGLVKVEIKVESVHQAGKTYAVSCHHNDNNGIKLNEYHVRKNSDGYSMAHIMEVAANETLSLTVSATDSTSVGDFIADHISVVITPVV